MSAKRPYFGRFSSSLQIQELTDNFRDSSVRIGICSWLGVRGRNWILEIAHI
jgi:hypothetical protein